MEVEMSKRRKNQFRASLNAKREDLPGVPEDAMIQRRARKGDV